MWLTVSVCFSGDKNRKIFSQEHFLPPCVMLRGQNSENMICHLGRRGNKVWFAYLNTKEWTSDAASELWREHRAAMISPSEVCFSLLLLFHTEPAGLKLTLNWWNSGLVFCWIKFYVRDVVKKTTRNKNTLSKCLLFVMLAGSQGDTDNWTHL